MTREVKIKSSVVTSALGHPPEGIYRDSHHWCHPMPLSAMFVQCHPTHLARIQPAVFGGGKRMRE